ncbi:protein kinase C-binding protein 1 isoform X3 [Schistocerca cancellata]|uniref:protein kinase C-binding protein 1 isoform X3 n=1 Tax=Schistocerca cancellata TaxID=274614 RepID=UPI0021193AE1|nr:protein kinase C-binding protein 1 isoform X3 [Schistocerca cancellata]
MEKERGRSTMSLTGSRKRSKSCSDKDRVHGREDSLTRSSLSGLKSRSRSRSNLHKLLTDKEDTNGLPMKQDSNDSGLSTLPTRLTRSQNPAFVAKQRSFLQKVTRSSSGSYSAVKVQNEEMEEQRDDDEDGDDDTFTASKTYVKRKRERSEGPADPLSMDQDDTQKTKAARLSNSADVKLEKDKYCWTCHKEGVVLICHTCPRSFHLRCAQMETVPGIAWMCPECATIMHAENVDTRSAAMKQLSLDRFCSLLKFALNRLKSLTGSEPFWRPVDQKEFSRYREFVVHPMDFSQLEYNIRRKAYGSTEAFIADVKWILHDCIVFNTQHTKLTSSAKYILKVCKQEMAEIEICPDCYYNANTLKDTWFIEACRKPHILVWAKLKGYPFWPGKVLRVHDENADVRFFGAHDRAWVSVQCCYLYSKEMPAPVKSRKHELQICIKELEQHTKKLRERFGRFQLPPSLTPFDPTVDQLPLFLPHYKEEVLRMRRFKSRSRTFPGEDNESTGNNGDPLAISYELQGVTHQLKPPKQKRSKTPSIDRKQSTEELDGLTSDNSVGRASLIEWSKFEEEAAQIKLTESDIEDSETSVEIPSKRTKCERNVVNESGEHVVNEASKSFGKSGIVDILQKKLMSLEPTCDIPEPEVERPVTETQNVSDNSSSLHRDCLQPQNSVKSDGDSCSKVVPNGTSDSQLKISGRVCEISDVNITSGADNTAFNNEQITDFLSSVDSPNKGKDLKELLPKELKTGTKGESSQPDENVPLQKETTKSENSPVLDKAESNTDSELLDKKYSGAVQERVLCSVPVDSELKVPENESVTSNSLDSGELGLTTERQSCNSEIPNDSSVRANIPKSVIVSVSSVSINDEMKTSSEISLESKQVLLEQNVKTELLENSGACTENSSNVISLAPLVKQLDSVTELKTTTNKLSAELSVEESSHPDVNIMDPVKKQALEKYKDADEEGSLKEENFNQQSPYWSNADIVDFTPRNDAVDGLNDIYSKESEYSDEKLILLSDKDPIKVSSSKEPAKDGSVLCITVTTSDAVPEHGYSRRTTEEVTITADKLDTEKFEHNKNVESDTLIIEKREEEEKEWEEKCEEEEKKEEEKCEEDKKEQKEEKEEEEEEEGQEEGRKGKNEPTIPSAKFFVFSSEDVNRVGGKERENISENGQLSLCNNSDSGVDKGTTILESSALPEISVVKSVPEQQWENLTDYEADDSPDTSDEHIVVKMSANVRHSPESKKETSKLSFDDADENKIPDVSVRPSGIRIRDVSVMCVKRKATEAPMTTKFKEENKSDIEPASDVKISDETHTSGDENPPETEALNQPEIQNTCVSVNKNTNILSVSQLSTSLVCEEQKEVNITATDKYPASENVGNIEPDESNTSTINTNKTSAKSVELVKATDDILLPFEMVCEHESDEDIQSENEMAEESVTKQAKQSLQMVESSNAPDEQLEQCTQDASPKSLSNRSTSDVSEQLEQCMQDTSQKSLSNRSPSDISSDATTKNLNTCKTVLVGIKYSKQASALDIPGRATPESVILLPNSRAEHGQNNNVVENSMDDSLDAQYRSSPVLGNNQSYLPCATSDAGPNTAEFHKHAEKIANFCCNTLQEILREFSNAGDEKATIKALQLEIEKINWQHKQEIAELRHNADLIASELRANLLTEHRRLMNEAKHRWEMEKKRAVEETKKKQWCSYCGKEAIFYCCWNTSYCDTNCQRKHWPQHVGACRHISGNTAQEEPSATGSVTQQTQVFGKQVISLQPQKSAHLLVPSVPLPTISRQPGVRYASYTTVNSRSPTILGTAVQVVASKPQQSATILPVATSSGNLYFTTARLSAPPPLNRVNAASSTPATLIYPATYSQAGSKKQPKVTQSNFVNK